MAYLLAMDQGTTSSRAVVFDDALTQVASAQEEFPQHFPGPGLVEHDPEDIWRSSLSTARAALAQSGAAAAEIAAIGIANQRETVLLWDRETGKALHPAIVWQDRRTARLCETLRGEGLEPLIRERSGLLLDPYFSGTKLAWLLDRIDGARARAEAGALAFGTVDSYLIWRLTGGRAHVTDATNAARTMLYDIGAGQWDAEICRALGIPMALLPEVRDSAGEFGTTDPALFGAAIPIRGVAGDQQAATVGQACFRPGMVKATYGTGCFALLNTGTERVESGHRLLTTIAYRIGGRTTYALEGSIFVAGAVVQWLRDRLGIIATAAETQGLAETADPEQELVLVPAFTGLGAPYWKPDCRGAVYGLTRNSGPAELARAALESVGYQTRDLIEAMQADWGGDGSAGAGEGAGARASGEAGALAPAVDPALMDPAALGPMADAAGGAPASFAASSPRDMPASGAHAAIGVLRVDGGMAASDWAMQFLADILGAPVDRPAMLETTALGAAWLAGLASGLCPGPEDSGRDWTAERRFDPAMAPADRDARYARWQRAVAATISV